MSANGSNECQEGYIRDAKRRRMVLDLDLNYPPLDDNISQTGPREEQAQENGHSLAEATNNAGFIDNDNEVTIISPRKFAEARSGSQRNYSQRSCGVIDRFNELAESYSFLSESTSWFPLTHIRHRSPQDQAVLNWELYMNLEVSNKIKTSNVLMPSLLPQSEPLPEAPTFSCAICMSQLVEETSTKCGHIFCKKCIDVAIATQHKCPTCRHKLKKRDTIRVYLPTTS